MGGSRGRKRNQSGEKRPSPLQESSDEWADTEGRSEDDDVRSTKKTDGGRGFSIWRRGDPVRTTGLRSSERRRAPQREPPQGQHRRGGDQPPDADAGRRKENSGCCGRRSQRRGREGGSAGEGGEERLLQGVAPSAGSDGHEGDEVAGLSTAPSGQSELHIPQVWHIPLYPGPWVHDEHNCQNLADAAMSSPQESLQDRDRCSWGIEGEGPLGHNSEPHGEH